jgi:putative hemolysin
VVWDVIILLVLIAINGFFALAEIALVSARAGRLEYLKDQNTTGADIAIKLTDDPDKFLSSIQVGITLVTLIMGLFGGSQFSAYLQPLFVSLDLNPDLAQPLAMGLTIFIITYFTIVLGELVPKTAALSKPERIACAVAPIISGFSILFYPFIRILSFSTSSITRLLGWRAREDIISSTELRHMVKVASKKGVIAREQRTLHEKVFYFSDKKARHLMTHKENVEWVNTLQSPENIHNDIQAFTHSKVICARDSLQHIQGVISLRSYYQAFNQSKEVSLRNLLIDNPLFVNSDEDASNVLSLMRESGVNFCLVASKNGAFEGIITLTDIMENIMGRLPNDGSPYEPPVFQRADGTFLVSGRAPVEVLEGLIPELVIDFNAIDYSSVGGFVLSHIQKRPELGDHFSHLSARIEIVDIDEHSIDKVLVSLKSEAGSEKGG